VPGGSFSSPFWLSSPLAAASREERLRYQAPRGGGRNQSLRAEAGVSRSERLAALDSSPRALATNSGYLLEHPCFGGRARKESRENQVATEMASFISAGGGQE